MNKTKYVSLAVGLVAIASLAIAIPASAQMMPSQGQNGMGGMQMHGGFGGMGGMKSGMRPGIFGTISAINGTTLSVNARKGFGTSTPTTAFTVDASNAVVKKNNATSTVSSIAVGDTVMVQGRVTGTNVVATMIRDGVVPMRGGMMGGKGLAGVGKSNWSATSTPAFSGNGEPVVAGTVSAVDGTSISITNKSNVSYTVDVTNAKILAGNTTSSIANIKVGDTLLVQGTVNGSSITATTVIDQAAKPAESTAPSGKPAPHGIFGGIGAFFSHLFGF